MNADSKTCVLEVHKGQRTTHFLGRRDVERYGFGQFNETPYPLDFVKSPPDMRQEQDSCGGVSLDREIETPEGTVSLHAVIPGEIRSGVYTLAEGLKAGTSGRDVGNEVSAMTEKLAMGIADEAFDALKDMERFALQAHFGLIRDENEEKYTRESIAADIVRLGYKRKITAHGVKKLIERAQKKLRKEFRRRYGSTEKHRSSFLIDTDYWSEYARLTAEAWARITVTASEPKEEPHYPILEKDTCAAPAPLRAKPCKNPDCGIVLVGRRPPLFRVSYASGDPEYLNRCPLCRAFRILVSRKGLCELCVTQRALNGYCDACFTERLADEWLRRRSARTRAVPSFDERVGARTSRHEWHIDLTREGIGFKSDVTYTPIGNEEFHVDSLNPLVRVDVVPSEKVIICVFSDALNPMFNLEDMTGELPQPRPYPQEAPARNDLVQNIGTGMTPEEFLERRRLLRESPV
jgi:hypothetical protein